MATARAASLALLLGIASGVATQVSGATDIVWVEDALPKGASAYSGGGDSWVWVSSNPLPYAGTLTHQSALASGTHQHYFLTTSATLVVGVGDALFAYVYLDPANPPSQVMLQWNDGSWEHRAYWGANLIAWGTNGSASRRYMGALPAAGRWVRLQVPAAQVGLEGRTLNGMAFAQYNGRATWDHAGKATGTSQPMSRDPLKWPFASTSIWNMPIGSNAAFSASGLHFNANVSSSSAEYWYDLPQADVERIILKPTAPLTNVVINNVGWSGGNRCVQQGSVFFQAPIPASYVIPNSTYNNGAAILMADGKTLTQTQPFTRCAGYSYATTLPIPWNLAMWQYDIKTGDGILGAHGGSQLSTLGGTIRVGEFRPGTQMRHALKVNVFSVQDLGLCVGNIVNCYTWPAAAADGYAANLGSGYGSRSGNSNPYMKMGALLAIPSSVNINSIGLQSEPGKMLAWTLQNYGAYIVDSRGSSGFDISVEDGADGSKLAEFKADYGFDMQGRLGYSTLKDANGIFTPQAKWVQDVRLIIDNLRVVTNNSKTSIGGGGVPLQPLAPPFQ